MKKNSKAISIFRDFVVMIERYNNIKVWVLHTNFGKFNSDAAIEYFSHMSIIWEPSTLHAQQQNEVVEQYMRTIV